MGERDALLADDEEGLLLWRLCEVAGEVVADEAAEEDDGAQRDENVCPDVCGPESQEAGDEMMRMRRDERGGGRASAPGLRVRSSDSPARTKRDMGPLSGRGAVLCWVERASEKTAPTTTRAARRRPPPL